MKYWSISWSTFIETAYNAVMSWT